MNLLVQLRRSQEKLSLVLLVILKVWVCPEFSFDLPCGPRILCWSEDCGDCGWCWFFESWNRCLLIDLNLEIILLWFVRSHLDHQESQSSWELLIIWGCGIYSLIIETKVLVFVYRASPFRYSLKFCVGNAIDERWKSLTCFPHAVRLAAR